MHALEPFPVAQKRGGHSLQVARTAEELQNLRESWQSLQWHPNTDFDFYLLVLASRKDALQPYVIVLSLDGRPASMLVGRVEDADHRVGLGYRTGFKLKVKSLTFLTGGILGDIAGEAWPELLAHLKSELRSGEFERVRFSNLNVNSGPFRAVTRLANWPWKDHAWESRLHWKMKIPGEAGGLLKRMSKKHRYWIRRLEKKLDEAFPGRVVFKHFGEIAEVRLLCEEAERVAKRTYLRGMGEGFADNWETRARFELDAAHQRLCGYLAYVDGEPRAFWIGSVYQGAFHAGFTGYDPGLKEYELGTLLFVYMVDDLAREGLKVFDFGLGDALYKQRFGDESWLEASVSLYAPSVKGVMLTLLGTGNVLVAKAARWVLARLGLFYRLKKYWRNRLTKPDREAQKPA